MIQAIINTILQFIEGLVVPVIAVLPDSPFQKITFENLGPLSNVMGYINYFVPMGEILAFLGLYLVAVAIWYGARWMLRIAKYID